MVQDHEREQVLSEYESSQVGTQRIPRQPAVKGQLDVVLAPVQLGQHPEDVVARICPSLPGQAPPLAARDSSLASSRVGARNGCIQADVLAGPDGPENRHAVYRGRRSGIVSRTVGQIVKRSIAPRAVALVGVPSGR